MSGDDGTRVWVNGRLLDHADEPAVSVSDHGLTVGDGVFEAVKVVEGRAFALTRHLHRLGRSAAGLGLPAPDESRVREAVSTVLAGSAAPLGRLRITYTGGPAPMGSGRATHASPTLVVALGPLEPRTTPSSAVTVPWPRNERGRWLG